eukprot:13212800-Alexandrium_andersonii.AAC.1
MGVFAARGQQGCLQIVAARAPGESPQRTTIWQELAEPPISPSRRRTRCATWPVTPTSWSTTRTGATSRSGKERW